MDEKIGGRRAVARPVAIGGVALLAMAGGASAAYAATHHSASVPARVAASTNTPTPPTLKMGRDGHKWRLRGILPALGIAPFGDMLHGQVVVAKQGGGYETMDVQRGSVTAVSSSSITVKSSDGFSATYAVTSSTNVIAESAGIGSVKVGDKVMVSAVVSGKTANAVVVADASAIRAGRAQFKPAAFPGPAAQQPPSAPNS
jgi:hypothetical protein